MSKSEQQSQREEQDRALIVLRLEALMLRARRAMDLRAELHAIKQLCRVLGLDRPAPETATWGFPGVKWVRAATFYAILDTPFRFRGPSALWKYMGIGLERRTSGQGPVILGVPSLGYHFHVVLKIDHLLEPAPHEGVVIDDHD